jgi:DNA-binding NarL/FixJ family response regulator
MTRIKIILADDHVVVRKGLRSLINQEPDMTVVAEADNGLQLLDFVEKLQPDVVLVDLKMPVLNGIDAAAQIHKRFPDTHTVILTMHADPAYVNKALQAGVSGYVLKEEDIGELCTTIRHVARGERYFSTAVSHQIEANFYSGETQPHMFPVLSLREQQVFQLMAEGKTNNEIASILGISARTVEGHRAHMMAKLNLKTHIDFVHFALKHGIFVKK